MQQLALAGTQHHLFLTPRSLHSVILFVNSGSGGQSGNQLLSPSTQGKELNEVYSCHLYVFQINDSQSRSLGMQFLRSMIEQCDTETNKVIVMAGGGDGTVNWLLTELIKEKIDHRKIYFGALPLGTGNDFAKNLGWNEVTLFKGEQGVKEFFSKIRSATFEEFDVWEVQVFCNPGGCIIQVSDGKEKKLPQPTILKQMTNYFSFGMDARVGYHFDKKRSGFQFLNLLIYCLIGCVNRCKGLPTVEKVVRGMKQGEEQEQDMSLVFSTDVSQDKRLLRKFRHILALNIDSYMGGVKDVWKKAKGSSLSSKSRNPNLNLSPNPYPPNPNPSAPSSFHTSSHNDGLLQFVAFPHQWSLGCERVLSGQATKIAQGPGQFRFEFHQQCPQTYLNFDGEYFKIISPGKVVIRKSRYFRERKLRVVRCGK